jgi:DNA modification methylase
MLPAIARSAIEAYTAPGDTVVDPMCGVGTTLVEAVHLGRDAVGVEYEPRWAELAVANLAHAEAGVPPDTVRCSSATGATSPRWSIPRSGDSWRWW